MATKDPEKRRQEWKRYYEKNREKLLLKQKNCSKKKDYSKRRYKEKREEIRAKQGQYAKTQTAKSKKAARQSKRRASKIEATPSWLDKNHHEQIENFYWLARDLNVVTGETYHVDHIIPLKGENVCGLHVPWNLQVLPSDLNLQKSNRIGDSL